MREQKRILIVSNNHTSKLVEIMETSLNTFGYEIMTTVHTGPALESAIVELMPHMVIVDFSLSYMEGIRISLQIRQWSPLPVLVLTPNTSRPNAVSTLSLNRNDYLSDPLDVSDLSLLVENILGSDLAPSSDYKNLS
jgi:two-component system KDP operon response regulator KdpE